MAIKLVSLAKEYNLPIVIHGRAYKPYVPYTIGSYSELVGHFVEQEGFTVKYADPLTGDTVEDNTVAVVLVAHDPAITYAGTGVDVKEDSFYFKFGAGSVILDPWRTMLSVENCTIVQYGNTRIKQEAS
jgi:UDPglucose 6-dehydrogenase